MSQLTYNALVDSLEAVAWRAELDAQAKYDDRGNVIGPACFKIWARNKNGDVVATSDWRQELDTAVSELVSKLGVHPHPTARAVFHAVPPA